jgi:putative ABC transport system permease protein
MLLSVFGAVALILSAIGIYGVISFLVGQRRREIGIRLALGATPAAVRRLIVQRGAVVGSMGAAVGLFAALALARIIEHRLSRVTAVDPVIFVGSVVVLISVSVLACIAPAWRASRLDPAITLRQE